MRLAFYRAFTSLILILLSPGSLRNLWARTQVEKYVICMKSCVFSGPRDGARPSLEPRFFDSKACALRCSVFDKSVFGFLSQGNISVTMGFDRINIFIYFSVVHITTTYVCFSYSLLCNNKPPPNVLAENTMI